MAPMAKSVAKKSSASTEKGVTPVDAEIIKGGEILNVEKPKGVAVLDGDILNSDGSEKGLTVPDEELALEEDEMEEAQIIKDAQLEVEKKITDTFNPRFVKTLKRLSYYLSKIGLPFDEACKMVRYDGAKMREIIKLYPVIQELIELKELEYKAELMGTVSSKARSGNDKLAQWLLETRFPNEFGSKKKGTPESEDMLGAAISFIQQSGDSSSLVRRDQQSGRAVIFGKGAGAAEVAKRLGMRDSLI